MNDGPDVDRLMETLRAWRNLDRWCRASATELADRQIPFLVRTIQTAGVPRATIAVVYADPTTGAGGTLSRVDQVIRQARSIEASGGVPVWWPGVPPVGWCPIQHPTTLGFDF